MRIAVLEKDQSPTESPKRHISKKRAESFVYRSIARWLIVDRIIQMVKEHSEIRGDYRFLQPELRVREIAKRRRPEGLLLYYPHRDQISVRA
jgi:hypothetical protein